MVNGEWLRAVTIYHSPFTIYLLDYPNQVRHLLHHAAHRGRVGALKNLVELREPDAAHDLFLRLREADGAPVVLDANLPAFLLLVLFRHFSNPLGCWVLGFRCWVKPKPRTQHPKPS